jgi:hypothetical protein
MREIEANEMTHVFGGLRLPPHPPAGMKLSNGRPVTQANWDYYQMVLKDVSLADFRKLQQRQQQRPIGWDPSVPGGGFLETPGGR